MTSVPPVTLYLLIINVVMFLATIALQQGGGIDLNNWLGLHFWKASGFNPCQFFTYQFMHGGFSHLFFNMFSLWMLGPLLERVLGSRRYLLYYIICGIGAGLAQELMWHFTWQDSYNALLAQYPGLPVDEFYDLLVTIGASGAIFGILLAFGMIFPNLPLSLMFIPYPVKAKWFVLGYGVIELLFGVTRTMNGVAHYAHLGGMITGIILILYWKHNGTLRKRYGIY